MRWHERGPMVDPIPQAGLVHALLLVRTDPQRSFAPWARFEPRLIYKIIRIVHGTTRLSCLLTSFDHRGGTAFKNRSLAAMPHSSEAIDSPPVSQPSSPLGMQPWSREEDAVLLRHALQCGTKQWGELERSGQLKRSNKSCCNRYIFLR
ncbi:unnamed protein product, partial [Closterium sp. NIES-54]